VQYFQKGGEVYSKLLSFGDKYGTLIKAPQYIGIFSDESSGYEKAGYIGEWMILELAKLDIGAKWLEFIDEDDHIKRRISPSQEKKLVGLIALGYAVTETKLGKIIKEKYRGSIKKLTNMGYPESAEIPMDDNVPYQLNIREFAYHHKFGKKIREKELENSGLKRVFQELHLAPTITKVQPWRLIIDEGKIHITMVNYRQGKAIAELEAGMIRYYLEQALKNNGIPTEWHRENIDGEQYKLPKNAFITGYFNY
jgi:nitroreductase